MQQQVADYFEKEERAMMRDLIGQQLGNYRLLSLIGRGGFSDVYLGQHVRISMQAAVKVLHAHLSDEEINGFQQEAETIGKLVHPHIVRVLDFDVSNGIPFLVMDYYPHGTLRKRHPKGEHIPISIIVSYIKQVADALQYAHDHKLIHRDIKPANMLIGRHNDILLSDFGIASTAHNTASMMAQTFAGTAPYMAPEQIELYPRRESDQYALAIVTYEWLAGELPFVGTHVEIAIKHLTIEPPSLCQKLPNLSVSVEEVVFKALAKEPKERFPTVQDFAIALEEASLIKPSVSAPLQLNTALPQPKSPQASSVLTLLPVTPVQTLIKEADTPTVLHPLAAMPVTETTTQTALRSSTIVPPAPEQLSSLHSIPRLKLTRRKGLVALAATGIVAVGGGTIWEILASRPTSSPPNSQLRYTYTGHTWTVYTLAWSPNGKRIASGASDNTVQVWNPANGGNVYRYHGHSDTVYAVAWSPDGKRIASGSNDKTVQIWDAANGGNAYSYQGHSGTIYAVAWSPDGTHIASASADNTVQVWNPADRSLVYIYRGHTGQVYTVTWSPDGKRIASGGRDNTVQVWDAITGNNVHTYHGHSDAVNTLAWSRDGTHIASGGYDHTVHIWSPAMEGKVYIYQRHSNVVNAVTWSFDSKRIASASNDKTVQVWNATNGSNVYTYHRHLNIVETVGWSPHDKQIASGSWDGTVQVWQAP
jgi:WD40 repeat protein